MTSRREFLTKDLFKLFKETYEAVSGQALTEEEKQAQELEEYFKSFKTCYPFLAEASLEELQYDARELGIDPTGISKYELARMIFKCKSEI